MKDEPTKWILYRIMRITNVVLIILCLSIFALMIYVMVELSIHVRSDEFRALEAERSVKRTELIEWYRGREDLPAPEFLMGVRDRYNQRMMDDLREEAWQHHREVIGPGYDRILDDLP